MYTLIITIHVLACLILIAVILLQAGRGSGLSELFGSSSTQTIFGARAPKFLSRTTAVAAIVFLLTCVSLTIFSSRRVRSLLSDVEESEVVEQSVPEETDQPDEAQP